MNEVIDRFVDPQTNQEIFLYRFPDGFAGGLGADVGIGGFAVALRRWAELVAENEQLKRRRTGLEALIDAGVVVPLSLRSDLIERANNVLWLADEGHEQDLELQSKELAAAVMEAFGVARVSTVAEIPDGDSPELPEFPGVIDEDGGDQ